MKVDIKHLSDKKYLHKLGHDVSTTSGYGFVQPCLCRELSAQDTVNLRIGQIVRLNPMPKPTFGDIKLKTYTSFIKSADIYHPFESLLSGQAYNGVGNSYIPTEVPNLRCADMLYLIYAFSRVNFYVCNSSTNFSDHSVYSTGTRITSSDNLTTYYNIVASEINDKSPLANDVLNVLGTALYNRYGGISTSRYCFDYTDDVIAPGSHDWSYCFKYLDPDTQTNKYLVIIGRLNQFGRNLRKIWLGLGYQINVTFKKVSLMPLLAYYKAYFDIFAPQRNMTWKNTNCFKVVENMEQWGLSLEYAIARDTAVKEAFADFILDLCTAFYTINPDYASANIVGVSTETASYSDPTISFLDADGSTVLAKQSSPNNKLPSVDVRFAGLSRAGINVVERLTKLMNISTAVGGRIRDYMRSMFNSEYVDEVDSQLLGTQSLSCEIKPVFNTAESAVAALGEFGGQSLGSDDGTKAQIKFTAKAHGFLISFFAIVPDAKLCQAIDPCNFHIGRFDFYHREFDGVSLVPSNKLSIYGHGENFPISNVNILALNSGFGNIPFYTDYKICHNILNGEMSLGSTRAGYLPFTVDKLLPFGHINYSLSGDKYSFEVYPGVIPSRLVAGTFWRYIGRDQWYGNFNRIFYNDDQFSEEDYTSRAMAMKAVDDNFIIQMYVDLNVYGYYLPMSKSYDTGAMDGDTMSVEKA